MHHHRTMSKLRNKIIRIFKTLMGTPEDQSNKSRSNLEVLITQRIKLNSTRR